MDIKNILSTIPQKNENEVFETILQTKSFRLERIVSTGQATQEGEWYDQDTDEWVLLLKGEAGVRIEGKDKIITLQTGDYTFLPAYKRHRVEWTAHDQETIWLALHF